MPTEEKTPEQRQKEIMKMVLDRVSEDPAFKEQLLDDPDAALGELGLTEEIEEQKQRVEQRLNPELAEVEGHHHLCRTGFNLDCYAWSSGWMCQIGRKYSRR